MKHIIIGDVHGMARELMQLLDAVGVNADDRLVFTGDLVGRGPDSLDVMRFLYKLRTQVTSVLGNHDLHALFMHASNQTPAEKTRLAALLTDQNADELFAWMGSWSLMYVDDAARYIIAHAGIHPCWSVDQAAHLAQQTKTFIKEQGYKQLSRGYGNMPNQWTDALRAWDRARFVINAFTRMRYLHTNTDALDFDHTCHPQDAPAHLLPWFAHTSGTKHRADMPHNHYRLFFGHWAALNGDGTTKRVYALDTGCVWGGALTAYVIDTNNKNTEYVRVDKGTIVRKQDR